MKVIVRYLTPYWFWLLIAVGFLFLQANCDLALPDYMSKIVDVGILRGGVESSAVQEAVSTGNAVGIQLRYMVNVGGMMLLLTLIGAVATVVVGFISSQVGAGLARDLRAAVFSKVQEFSSREFDRFSTASLITRTVNDVMQIQMLIMMGIRMIIYAPIIGVGGVIRAIGKSTSMWWIIALAVGILIALVTLIFSLAVPKFKLMQRLVDKLNLVSRERLTGMMVIRAFGTQEWEEQRFDQVNRDLSQNLLFVNRVMILMMPLMTLIMSGISLLITWVGAGQIAASTLRVGDMMAFMQYAIQIVFSFLMMSFMFIALPRAAVSAERIAEVLNMKASIKDPVSPKILDKNFPAKVEFRDVCFRYPGAEEDVLKNISFTALPGQTTAIIGSTGSGKTSAVNLIPRLYDVSSGTVLVGGVDVRELTQQELRDKIGYVSQKARLFSGTVESNLLYADEKAPPETIEWALTVSQSKEFVEAMSEGASISQGGGNLSGGQRLRLSIARALVKKAPIYIFDDSFSALDLKTDAALRRALRTETQGAAVILVTQRVATIKGADQIIVLDEGRVVGIGNHKKLMESCLTYREIASSQLSEEELG